MADINDDGEEDLIVDLNEPDDEPAAPQQGAAQAAQTTKPPPVPGPKAPRPSGSVAPAAPQAPQAGVRDLEAQLAAERTARSRAVEENRRAQQERDQAIAFAQEAERRGMTVYELYNETQIRAATEQLETLTAQQEAAMENGDFKTAADCNRRMHRLGGDLALLERDKGALAQQRANMTAQHQRSIRPAASPQQPQVPTDPIERAISGRTEPTKQFLRKHPELIRNDGSLKRAAIDAHESALDQGHQVDTPGYFDYIEGIIGQGGAAGGATGGATVTNGRETPSRQRAPSMAAPVERGSPPGGGGALGPETFVMTPKMRRLAEEQGVTPREWAQNYVRLLREGRITPVT